MRVVVAWIGASADAYAHKGEEQAEKHAGVGGKKALVALNDVLLEYEPISFAIKVFHNSEMF